MEEKELRDELTSIRSLMERSSKFISLSGLSGILAGVYALIGAGIAYKLIDDANPDRYVSVNGIRVPIPHYGGTPSFNRHIADPNLVWELIAIGVVVLLASVITAILLSSRQAKRKGQHIWGTLSQSLLFHVAVPLVTGGMLTLIFVFRGYYSVVSPACLIFYGLALVSASNFTFGEVKYLGLLEIALGLICACLPGYGLLFWAFGFGVLHIIYGGMMYFKYDK
jgi:hypothetical protein